jgi:hypothetical protein
MEEERLEFFKLDNTDREVLLWLIDHVDPRSIRSWLTYIADDYKRTREVFIDTEKLFKEIQERK